MNKVLKEADRSGPESTLQVLLKPLKRVQLDLRRTGQIRTLDTDTWVDRPLLGTTMGSSAVNTNKNNPLFTHSLTHKQETGREKHGLSK